MTFDGHPALFIGAEIAAVSLHDRLVLAFNDKAVKVEEDAALGQRIVRIVKRIKPTAGLRVDGSDGARIGTCFGIGRRSRIDYRRRRLLVEIDRRTTYQRKDYGGGYQPADENDS